MKVEICDNCNREIGLSEQALVLDGRIVCEECYANLKFDYVAIAKIQQLFLFLLLVELIILPLLIFLSKACVQALLVIIWGLIGWLLLFVFIALMRAMKLRIRVIFLYIIGFFIPIVNIILWIYINYRAIKILQAVGYRVGLMGVKYRDLR